MVSSVSPETVHTPAKVLTVSRESPTHWWAAAWPGRALRRRTEQHVSDHASLLWRAPKGPEGQAAVPVGGDNTTASQVSHVIYLGHFLRCPINVVIPTMHIRWLNEAWRNYLRSCWLTAIAERQGDAPNHTPARQAPPVWRAPEGPESQAAVPVGGGRAWPNTSATQHRRHRRCGGRRRDRRARLRCPWAAAGPGRASSRRAERSSRRGRLAGGPPPTGTPSSPARQNRTRGARNTSDATQQAHKKPTSAIGCRSVVELGGFEPPTFSLRTRRATNCAIAPRTQTA